jgi:hypothetical protein
LFGFERNNFYEYELTTIAEKQILRWAEFGEFNVIIVEADTQLHWITEEMLHGWDHGTHQHAVGLDYIAIQNMAGGTSRLLGGRGPASDRAAAERSVKSFSDAYDVGSFALESGEMFWKKDVLEVGFPAFIDGERYFGLLIANPVGAALGEVITWHLVELDVRTGERQRAWLLPSFVSPNRGFYWWMKWNLDVSSTGVTASRARGSGEDQVYQEIAVMTDGSAYFKESFSYPSSGEDFAYHELLPLVVSQ